LTSTLRQLDEALSSTTAGWWLQHAGGRARILSGDDDNPDGYVRKAEEFVVRHFPSHLHGAVALARHIEVRMAMRVRGPG
jgi:hypothetical protein